MISSTVLSVARTTALGELGRDEGLEVDCGLNTGGLGNLWRTEGHDGGRRTLETGGAFTGWVPAVISESMQLGSAVFRSSKGPTALRM